MYGGTSGLIPNDLVWLPLAFFFLLVEVFLLIFPFLPPSNGVGDTPPLPYYLYCLIGIAVMSFGVLYWAVWKLVLPYVFKFHLVPRKEVLKDGMAFSSPMKRWNKCNRVIPGEDYEPLGVLGQNNKERI